MILTLKLLKKKKKKKTGLKVSIHHKKIKRDLSFEYNSNDQLDRLVMVIKANY